MKQENTNINALNFEIDALKREIKALKHQKEQMYSEEEVIKFAKWCAELKVWDNQTYVNNTFEELFNQFKNK